MTIESEKESTRVREITNSNHIIVNVKVYYYSVFKKGSIHIILNNEAFVEDALNELKERFGEVFEKETGKNLMESFGKYFNVFLNGSYLDLPSELNRKLKNKDQLIILRPVSGG